MDRTEVFAQTFEALDKLLAPSPASVAEQERIAAKIAEYKREDAMFEAYRRQRAMGFEHDKIIHLYPCRNTRYFHEWYREEQLAGSPFPMCAHDDGCLCWDERDAPR
jgi:hypothetical protein